MKRLLLLITAILLALCLTACLPNDGPNNGGTPDPTPTLAPTLTASGDIFVLGGEPVTLTVGGIPDGYLPSAREYTVISGNPDIITIDGDSLAFTALGRVTLGVSVDGVSSTDTVTVTAINPDSTVAERLGALLSTAPALGSRADIGITADNADLYSFERAEEYLTLDGEGRLEFIGLRPTRTRVRLYRGETLVYEGMYSMAESKFNQTVINSLVGTGHIPSVHADAPASLLATVTSLDLTGISTRSADEYAILDYFPALEELNLTGASLYDLSFLGGRDSIRRLILDNCVRIGNSDGGLEFYNTLESLTALENISLVGSIGALDRECYNILLTFVARGAFTADILDGLTLDATNAYDASESVLLTLDELRAHLTANGGKITPHEGYTHAIISLTRELDDLSWTYLKINTGSDLDLLELYGMGGCTYGTHLLVAGSLTLNLYDYDMYAYQAFGNDGIYHLGSELRVRAMRGYCSVTGAVGGNSYKAACGIESTGSVYLSAYNGATLYVRGGNGAAGKYGVSDGSNPAYSDSAKHGGNGGGGGHGLYAKYACIETAGITLSGGNGGRGGDGANGSDINIFDGGYNAGNGGSGGEGGYALFIKSYDILVDNGVEILGGSGGGSGAGGTGYLAGSNGDAGYPGVGGNEVGWY